MKRLCAPLPGQVEHRLLLEAADESLKEPEPKSYGPQGEVEQDTGALQRVLLQDTRWARLTGQRDQLQPQHPAGLAPSPGAHTTTSPSAACSSCSLTQAPFFLLFFLERQASTLYRWSCLARAMALRQRWLFL